MELVVTLCFGVFAGAMVMWAWWTINPALQIKKRKLKTLQKQIESEKEAFNELQTLVHAQLENNVEVERRRISDDLHDDLLQRLSGIRLYLLHIISIHKIPLEAEKQINRIANDLSDAVDTTRTLIWDLALPELKGKSLTSLLEELCQKLGRTALLKITCVSVMKEWEKPMSDDIKKDICRIVQESVYNALKSSNGWHINVTTQWHNAHVSVTVLDDGEGISEHKNEGFGMDNIRKRAERIKAKLEIMENKPHGTIVKVELPYSSLR
jgi:signal transduction histidine kinase